LVGDLTHVTYLNRAEVRCRPNVLKLLLKLPI
jgi:hypothetical protein